MLQFLYIYSIWCPWCSQVSVLRSVCAGGMLHCSATRGMCVVCTAHNTHAAVRHAATSPNLYNDVILPSVLT
jgi:hypothetical protein